MRRGFVKISEKQWAEDTEDYCPSFLVKYDEIILPKRGSAQSAGYDVYSTTRFFLAPDEAVLIPTGFKAYMMPDEFLAFYPRSGLGFKNFIRLANTVGIGDSDYYDNSGNEGHYWVKMRNEGVHALTIQKGDRIAQCIFQKYLLSDNDEVISSERKGGFGSTSR